MSHQIVVLAAGKGTRMGSPIPKVLIPLLDKPVIEHLLTEVSKVPQDTAPIIVVGFQHELVEKTLGNKYLYALQQEQNGTGHAVLSARDYITSENFLVLYGDMPFIKAESLTKLIELHESQQGMVSMFTATIPNFDGAFTDFRGFGRIIRDADGAILRITEHADCTDAEKKIPEVNPGIYMFNTSWLWPQLETVNQKNNQGEFYLTDIIEIAIADNQIIHSMPINPNEVYGINTPDHLLHAQTLIQT